MICYNYTWMCLTQGIRIILIFINLQNNDTIVLPYKFQLPQRLGVWLKTDDTGWCVSILETISPEQVWDGDIVGYQFLDVKHFGTPQTVVFAVCATLDLRVMWQQSC